MAHTNKAAHRYPGVNRSIRTTGSSVNIARCGSGDLERLGPNGWGPNGWGPNGWGPNGWAIRTGYPQQYAEGFQCFHPPSEYTSQAATAVLAVGS